MDDFSLVSDTSYVVQNASRILRGLFEIALRKSWVSTSSKLLSLSKTTEHRLWSADAVHVGGGCLGTWKLTGPRALSGWVHTVPF